MATSLPYFLKLEIEARKVGNQEQREERHLALLYLCFMAGEGWGGAVW